jgi:hypothetical protein
MAAIFLCQDRSRRRSWASTRLSQRTSNAITWIFDDVLKALGRQALAGGFVRAPGPFGISARACFVRNLVVLKGGIVEGRAVRLR